jgi:hypothetical protein
VKEGLQFVVIDGCVHIVKGDVDEVAGNHIDIGNGLGQQGLHALEGAVDIGGIDDTYHGSFTSRACSYHIFRRRAALSPRHPPPSPMYPGKWH